MKCPKCNFDNPADTKFCGECAAPLTSSKEIPASPTETLETPKEELTTGSVFAGRYQIIEVLGKGGMGKVYRALDKKLNEEVALKLVKPEIASDKKTLERFSNELKIARKIAHKNVGRMYELMEEKGIHFITMEYVPGEDLKSFIKRAGPLSAGKTTFIAKQVCEGLAEAHGLGVVHRDLKPQNIMIDKEGNSRIMDFGIARSLKAKGITAEGVIIGTPEYMSPEQVDAKETDQRSDIYSLGVILYEMVTGRVPFEGDTPLSVAVKQKTEAPEDPRKLNSQIPEDLSNVILRCLEKDKGKRYQNAGEVHSELNKIEKGIPTTERIVPKRKPITSREITVTFGLKKLLVPTLVVVAVIIAAVVIWQLLPQKKAVPVPSDKPSLAIIYFENISGDEKLASWRAGLSELLITDLSQSKLINILSSDRIFSILKRLHLLDAEKYSSEDLIKVANEGRVNHVIKGSYIKAGDNFIITVVLQKPQVGEVIKSIEAECKSEEEIPARVDELTKEIKMALNLSREDIASDIDKEVGKITTSSPEALKLFSDGMGFRNNSDYRQSIRYMERAIAIDPEFALAYRTIAQNYMSIGYRKLGVEFLQKALELADRVSERELYLIKGDFYSLSEETYDEAIEAYNKYLELYPNDEAGNEGLSDLYINIEEWDKALEVLEVNRKNKIGSTNLYYDLAFVYMCMGLYEKAREASEEFIQNFNDNSLMRRDMAQNYLSLGKYDLAHAEVDKAFFLSPPIYSPYRVKGQIYMLQGDFVKAEEQFRKLLAFEEKAANSNGMQQLAYLYSTQGRVAESINMFKQGIELAESMGEVQWKSNYHIRLAYCYLKSRNLEAALNECDKAWRGYVEVGSLSGQEFTLLIKGLIHLEMNEIDETQRTASELKKVIEKDMNKKSIRLHHHLLGRIELKRNNFPGAIENFEKAISLLPFQRMTGPRALFIEPLAIAYYKSENLERAKQEYEKILSLTSGRIRYGDNYAKSFYMLGKIYEKQGNKARAIEHYEKFLDLWKDADPGIAEVEDAWERLAGLKSLP
jgi:serine/threonine protein kinase/Tfp pilus assembly protein PilF